MLENECFAIVSRASWDWASLNTSDSDSLVRDDPAVKPHVERRIKDEFTFAFGHKIASYKYLNKLSDGELRRTLLVKKPLRRGRVLCGVKTNT